MSDENERSDASAGSVGEPLAFAVMQPDSYSVFVSKLLAEKRQELCMGGDIIPLYRHSQPTLTAAEREAVERAAEWLVAIAATRKEIHSAGYLVGDAATLRGLLERLA